MKNQIFCFLLACLFSLPMVTGQDKGYITLTQSETATTATYDAAVVKLKEAGVWELGWNFHALGTKQPAGLFSLGVYPDKAAMDSRVAKTDEVFKANNINVPTPAPFEVYGLARGVIPATIPAGAILVHHTPTGMTPELYEKIIAELSKVNALGSPAQYFHVAYKAADGNLNVIDVWESAEKFQAFGATLIPILEKLFPAAPPPPSIYSVYNTVVK